MPAPQLALYLQQQQQQQRPSWTDVRAGTGRWSAVALFGAMSKKRRGPAETHTAFAGGWRAAVKTLAGLNQAACAQPELSFTSGWLRFCIADHGCPMAAAAAASMDRRPGALPSARNARWAALTRNERILGGLRTTSGLARFPERTCWLRRQRSGFPWARICSNPFEYSRG